MLRQAKVGLSDRQLSHLTGVTEEKIEIRRKKLGIRTGL
jgi:hypothetical protein